MVEIQSLPREPNLVFRKGAAQHWTFGNSGMPGTSVWERLVLAHVSGRCLVVGPAPDSLVAAVTAEAAEVSIVTWAIPDAARLAASFPGSRVFCGDVEDLPGDLGTFDSVICTDLAATLSLECPATSWRRLESAVRRWVKPGGTMVLPIENDLAPHRITASHNPRSANSDADWAPLASWDDSRPRSIEQLRSLHPDAVWALGPGWPDVRVAWRLGCARDVAEALSVRAAAWPLRGPDPAWLLRSWAMADRLDEAAAAWLCVFGRPAELPDVLVPQGESLLADAHTAGRSLLGAFADACASHDVPTIRALLSTWHAATQSHPSAAPDLGAWLASDDDMVPLLDDGRADRDVWTALVDLIVTLRGRSWRHPWPSTTSDVELLAVLGAMAGMGDPPPRATEALSVGVPASGDPFAHLDRQQLVAAIDRNNETIRTLRSRLAWTERQYATYKALEKAKNAARRVKRAATQRVLHRSRP